MFKVTIFAGADWHESGPFTLDQIRELVDAIQVFGVATARNPKIISTEIEKAYFTSEETEGETVFYIVMVDPEEEPEEN